MNCVNCGRPIMATNLNGIPYAHTALNWSAPCALAHPTRKIEMSTDLQAGEILPQVGEVVSHVGRQYECTAIDWDREEDEIVITYRRRFADDQGTPLPDPFQGASAAMEWVDEAHEVSLSELQKRLFGA